MSDYQEFIENILAVLGSKIRRLARSFGGILAATLALLSLHFSGYILYFGLDLVQITEASAIIRFAFSAFIFFGLWMTVGRFSALYILSIFRNRPISRIADYTISKCEKILNFSSSNSNKTKEEIFFNGVGYFCGFVAFAFFYLGSWRALWFILIVCFVIALLFIGPFCRAAFTSRSFNEEVADFRVSPLLVVASVLFVSISGNLRASYVVSSKNYFVFKGVDGLGCVELNEGVSPDASEKEIFEGVIILTAGAGDYLYERDSMSIQFLPHELGFVVCVDRSYNGRYYIF